VTGKSGHARTCRGESDDVISSAGAAAARYWPLGADTGSAIKTRERRQSGRTEESDR